MALDHDLRGDEKQWRWWNTAPADPVMQAAEAGVGHYNRVLGRVLMPDSFMPLGEHRQKTMRHVPAQYLLYVWGDKALRANPRWAPVLDYIARFLPVILAGKAGLVFEKLTTEAQADYQRRADEMVAAAPLDSHESTGSVGSCVRAREAAGKPEWRPMTEVERAQCLALGQCTLPSGTMTQRFARQLCEEAHGERRRISEKQAAYLLVCCYRYRRQMPRDLAPKEPPPGYETRR